MSDNTMTDKQKIALELMQSLRGRFLIGKALHLAIESMEKTVPTAYSDIEDMDLLGKHLFSPFYELWDRKLRMNREAKGRVERDNEKEIQKKRDSGETYYVLFDKNPDRKVIAFQGKYTECESYIINLTEPNTKESDKYTIIYDMDEDGNFSI